MNTSQHGPHEVIVDHSQSRRVILAIAITFSLVASTILGVQAIMDHTGSDKPAHRDGIKIKHGEYTMNYSHTSPTPLSYQHSYGAVRATMTVVKAEGPQSTLLDPQGTKVLTREVPTEGSASYQPTKPGTYLIVVRQYDAHGELVGSAGSASYAFRG